MPLRFCALLRVAVNVTNCTFGAGVFLYPKQLVLVGLGPGIAIVCALVVLLAFSLHVLKAYLYAAGVTTFDLTGGKGKSNIARHLIGLLESKQATEALWSAAAGKLELR